MGFSVNEVWVSSVLCVRERDSDAGCVGWTGRSESAATVP